MTATFPIAGTWWDTTCVIGVSSRPATCDMADRGPLVELYTSTALDGWTVSTDWLSASSPCTWYGVTCSSSGTQVVALALAANNLGGTLPTSLGNLTALTYVPSDCGGRIWRPVGRGVVMVG